MLRSVETETFNLCTKKLESAVRYVQNQLGLKPRIIIAVDLFGLPAKYDRLNEQSLNINTNKLVK